MRVRVQIALMGMLIATGVPLMPVVAQPSLLGRGYTPYLNQVQEVAALRPRSAPTMRGASNTTQFGLVASNQDFERVMQADMSVSVEKVGFGANLRASIKGSPILRYRPNWR